MPNPIRQDGITYPSQKAFALAKGLCRDTVRIALNRGTIENCGKGRKRPVNFRGVDYPGIVDACAATGENRDKVIRWVRREAKKIARAQNKC